MGYIVLTTAEKSNSRELAEKAVNHKKAACATIINDNTSFFFWQGKIENEKEDLILLKVSDEKSNDLYKFIEENHPYDVPEIIGFKADFISEDYEKWLKEECK